MAPSRVEDIMETVGVEGGLLASGWRLDGRWTASW
jgi:hypothetical protein